MIPRTIPTWQSKSWQDELSSMTCSPEVLIERLNLDIDQAPQDYLRKPTFPVRATDSYIERINKGDWHDPLLRQIWPFNQEQEPTPGYTNDPLQEAKQTPSKGLIHKYQGRVLLIANPQCAIHCRYCFRREFDYSNNNPSRSEWISALSYIANNDSIEEVILSGGDPLVSSNKQLHWLIEQVEKIPHVQRLRIHTRIPIVLPKRIDDELCETLLKTRLQKTVVVHCNHANELDHATSLALQKLRQSNCTLLNQSVLLAGINDDAKTLSNLSKSLFNDQVLPYYLHLLDKVTGAAHFDVTSRKAQEIVQTLRNTLPGYLVPKLVKEEPGALSKTPV